MNNKLYVVTRRDLSPGAQACQLAHAMREFAAKFPEIEKIWYTSSNYLCFLSVADELALLELWASALYAGIRCAPFFEPDLDDALTAVSFEPTVQAQEFLQHLPLALREV